MPLTHIYTQLTRTPYVAGHTASLRRRPHRLHQDATASPTPPPQRRAAPPHRGPSTPRRVGTPSRGASTATRQPIPGESAVPHHAGRVWVILLKIWLDIIECNACFLQEPRRIVRLTNKLQEQNENANLFVDRFREKGLNFFIFQIMG